MTDTFDIDAWLRDALELVDRLVARGTLSPEQAQEMRERAPSVRARHLGEGPKDWVDAIAESGERNVLRGALPENEKQRLLAEIRAPHALALMRLNGPPGWLRKPQMLGAPGKWLADSLTAAQLDDLKRMERNARDRMLLMGDVSRSVTPSEQDTEVTMAGLTLLESCERFGKNPLDSAEFLEAIQLQALSLSLGNLNHTSIMLGDDCAAKGCQASAAWAQNGFPFIHIRDAKWCAQLCAMSVPGEYARQIRPPWSAFRVAVPQGILFIDTDDGKGDFEDCTRLMVLYEPRDTSWTLVLYGTTRMMHITGTTTEQLCEDIPTKKTCVVHDPGFRLTGSDGRTMRLAARLVLAICLSMINEGSAQPTRRSVKRTDGRASPTPVQRLYVLRPPVRVRVDVREALRGYVKGTQGKRVVPWVQLLVRGHWKMQPHGPGSLERKFIPIEPYWRGPEDAPIAVRPHVLTRPAQEGV